MDAQIFAKKVIVTIHPYDNMFTLLIHLGETDDEMPYPLLVEMPFESASRLRQELEELLPLLANKIETRHSTPTMRENP